MAGGPNMEQFELYFRRADMDQDGRITGPEAVAFFQATNLPKQVLAQIWTHADQNKTGFLGRSEFYNALKLVTVAQSKRDLTPDIVKAALYGPASAKIPAPQINLAVLPMPHPNMRAGTPSQQFAGTAPVTYQNTGTRGSQGFPPQQNQGFLPQQSQGFPPQQNPGFPPQQNQGMRPPRPLPPDNVQSQQGVTTQQWPGGGTMAMSSNLQSSSISTDWLRGGTGGPPAAVTSQVPSSGSNAFSMQGGLGPATSGSVASPLPGVQATTTSLPPSSTKLSDSAPTANEVGAKDLKTITNLGNGFASDPVFGDVFSAASVQVRPNSPVPASSANSLPVSSAIVPASTGPQTTARPSLTGPLQSAPAQVLTGSQNQHLQSSMKVNQQVSVQTANAYTVGGRSSASGQPNVQWPKMTQAAVQKYSKVFVEVDTDRDGKITGEQARNLFLSWRLPREILKQVWDLSDQDNDSMLSLREFCIALYLMERYREGRPLPPVLPNNIILEDTQFPATGQSAAGYGNASLRHNPGMQQIQEMPGPRPVAPAVGGRPPRPVPVPALQPDEENVQRIRQKKKLPELEKHLVDQLSTEEQNSLNSKFKELTEADTKVTELEKEIMESREKIEFYRTKMQELILYKSRCDSRLNEITERVSADRREVEVLAKKYEEKYKQSGDVASKLSIEEATFRDIQEKKMELYRAIVKMDQEGGADKIQVHADRIQSDLEEQVKTLNERCKTYGLRAKPTSLVELPFGWQPGVQEGAADWNEEWDHFEDEGFEFVKELTLDVKNVIAPPKSKAPLVRKETSQANERIPEPSSNISEKSENLHDGEMNPDHESEHTHKEDNLARSPLHSPSNKNAVKSPSKDFQDSPSKKGFNSDGSPHATDMQSEQGGAEPVLSEDRRFDEPAWGSFDTHYDTDAGWDFNIDAAKDSDIERHSEASLFGPDSWGLNPIRTESNDVDNVFQQKSTYGFADSVPGTPMSIYGATPHTDNLFEKKSPFAFTDSVPSTPMSSYGNSLYSDNMFQKNSTFGFADSVPSTPMYNSVNTPRRFDEGSEDHSFDLSRFDSFNEGGIFPSREFSRFDSMSSTRDSDNDHGSYAPRESFARFDSFRSTADSEYNPVFPAHDSFTRFDSIRSTRDSEYNQGFPSFDDTDPFGSSDPFKISVGSETPRRETDSWKAF
ncbi:hypothetical protein DCAR_0519079 [Daucus carota subsp. sativus]|uniref:Uncharacterized protein n=1 Tax=Daucus carota subsp. sativus TaxID=79200 RepID=A0AAF0X241_DAUCS|nr:PREDICTED: actin cytoskeleton-regulatory complex protein PAN1 [Daucus carota subsp. sativus]WOG99724.1 hypothetical protein DCAR_0519079 [Daucus carota subsp. sativus]